MEARVTKVESDIAAMQVDIRELRSDMKAANDSIGDLKAAVATVDGKVNALSDRMDGKFEALNAKLDANIGALNAKIDANAKSTDVRFLVLDGKMDKLDGKFDALQSSVHQLQGTLKTLSYAMALILGLAAIGKLLTEFLA